MGSLSLTHWLIVLLVVQICVGLRIEVAEVRITDSADAGEMSRHQVMFFRERQ